MTPATRSQRQEQRQLSDALRSRHKTWADIAAALAERYHVNARAALRMAHGWSQREAADKWNERWPADPKTFKNFSYWEQWPSATGHTPSLDVLARMAELYECSVSDLLVDCADFRSSDPAYRQKQDMAELPALIDHSFSSNSTIELSENKKSLTPELVSRLESMEVHDVARLTANWTGRIEDGTDRRALLLKLSAGLSLAAASPTAIDSDPTTEPSTPQIASTGCTLAGIWNSKYIYSSTGRRKDFTGEHYVVLRQNEDRILGQSIAQSTGSKLRLDLAFEPPIATGTWRETTSLNGYYKGASYHGTLQLVVDPSGRCMRGMWVGFGRDFTINSGQWELTWQAAETHKSAQRSYHHKL